MIANTELDIAMGRIVANRRKSKRISQRLLADLTCLSRASIANIELGKQTLTIENLCLIADALELDPGGFIPTRNQLTSIGVL